MYEFPGILTLSKGCDANIQIMFHIKCSKLWSEYLRWWSLSVCYWLQNWVKHQIWVFKDNVNINTHCHNNTERERESKKKKENRLTFSPFILQHSSVDSCLEQVAKSTSLLKQEKRTGNGTFSTPAGHKQALCLLETIRRSTDAARHMIKEKSGL